ncbi:hypothetical protein PBY51_016926 [Eleginops maclovinus]|uniref:Uncharacterized protein n=1 Tax=Eleginops maclovinus TaxID=56733 RepID=A0AAN8AAH8_ELEMC|nr:hypothetical protein PBY51_016926 [Eleginops maclovinus]
MGDGRGCVTGRFLKNPVKNCGCRSRVSLRFWMSLVSAGPSTSFRETAGTGWSAELFPALFPDSQSDAAGFCLFSGPTQD